MNAAYDEEALAQARSPEERRRAGAYFTPAALVRAIHELVSPLVPEGPLAVLDPSCGAGAFLAEAKARHPNSKLLGLELSEASARACHERLPEAEILVGDALRGGFEQLCAKVPQGAFELWLGNPPYNGTSPLLSDKGAYQRLLRQLPELELPAGTSLRDDYAFFLLLAAKRLTQRPGALAFITSASLLDAFLYAPLRRWLVGSLRLHEVVDLGVGVFQGTRVRTCFTVWTSPGPRVQARHRERIAEPIELGPAVEFAPQGPEWTLRPVDAAAAALDERWSQRSGPLSSIVPVSFPGLKTRFDELLVDEDPRRLFDRVDAFLRSGPGELREFSEEHGIPEALFPKLQALKADVPELRAAEDRCLRAFYRYAGARHRGALPPEARAYCYLDRRLIPRGDHRFQGEYDPHRGEVKLLFNTRELPLCAALLEAEGCVHAYRHSRFAPLYVPRRVLEEGPAAARKPGSLGPLVPNLSERALSQGKPLEIFRALVRFINSGPVQRVWAPAFGASRELPVPLEELLS